MAKKSKNKKCNIKVVIRVRPPSQSETQKAKVSNLRCFGKEVLVDQVINRVSRTPVVKQFTFDHIFDESATQKSVFEQAIVPVMDDVLRGFNCTVFAYGQTGTGKTYTMEGCATPKNPEKAGIIPRAMTAVFERLDRQKVQYFVKVSFLELYNEELHDLLSDEGKPLRIFEDANNGVIVHNLEEIVVTSAKQIFKILQKGIAKRMTAETKLNKHSSRSHCIFTTTVHMKEVDSSGTGEDVIKVGTLNLVDLAGSESIGRSGAVDTRAKEAGMINTSLLTLGRVISSLVDHIGHIPYRDSKLTRLLQESLGGKAKTVIIATISPFCNEETLSTLEYAHRAKRIMNKPVVNQKMSQQRYVRDMMDKLKELQRENECLREKNGVILPPEKYEKMVEEMASQKHENEQLVTELEGEKKRNEAFKATFQAKTTEFQDHISTLFGDHVKDLLTFQEQEQKWCTQLHSDIFALQARNLTELETLKNQVNELNMKLLADESSVARETVSHIDASSAGFQDLRKGLDDCHEQFKQATSKLVAEQSKLFSKLQLGLQAHREQIESSHELVVKKMDEASQALDVFRQQQAQSWMDVKEAVQTSADDQTASINQLSKTATDCLDEETSSSIKLCDALVDLIQSHKTARIQKSAERVITLQKSTENAVQRTQSSCDANLFVVQNTIGALHGWCASQKDATQQTVAEHLSQCQNQRLTIPQLSTSVTDCGNLLDSNVNALVDQRNFDYKQHRNQLMTGIQSCSRAADNLNASLKSVSQSRSSFVEKQLGDLISMEHQSSKFRDQLAQKQTFETEGKQKKFKLLYNQMIGVDREIQKFAANMKDGNITSLTPMKRKWSGSTGGDSASDINSSNSQSMMKDEAPLQVVFHVLSNDNDGSKKDGATNDSGQRRVRQKLSSSSRHSSSSPSSSSSRMFDEHSEFKSFSQQSVQTDASSNISFFLRNANGTADVCLSPMESQKENVLNISGRSKGPSDSKRTRSQPVTKGRNGSRVQKHSSRVHSQKKSRN